MGKNEAVLEWDQLPVDVQNGFIRNYTIFYRTVIGNETGNKAISVIKNQVYFLRLLNTNLNLTFLCFLHLNIAFYAQKRDT